jgi:hypothetical protein
MKHMAQQTNGNDQAFARPPVLVENYGLHQGSKGLTKREYFAAMALQGMCANSSLTKIWTHENIAEWSVQQADALIEALNK